MRSIWTKVANLFTSVGISALAAAILVVPDRGLKAFAYGTTTKCKSGVKCINQANICAITITAGGKKACRKTTGLGNKPCITKGTQCLSCVCKKNFVGTTCSCTT